LFQTRQAGENNATCEALEYKRVHIVTRNRYDISAHTEGIHSTPYGGKILNHGVIPKKTRENKLKTNSIIANSFCNYSITANPGRWTTYNAGQNTKTT
jgi:hypothetical protein